MKNFNATPEYQDEAGPQFVPVPQPESPIVMPHTTFEFPDSWQERIALSQLPSHNED